MSNDYNKTLNLPKTDYPMRADLTKREPGWLESWEKENLYNQIMERNEGKPLYVLHDGPPYANADIHLGTALNKVLKDFVVRYKNMSGSCLPFVPGWDTHGLPIELRARKHADVDASTKISELELRKLCKEYALTFVEDQKKQFKRLGVLGEWDNPYLTLAPEYVATQIEVFGDMARQGYIYKGLKPVYWCPECVTALAEAEIEYADDPCQSAFVKFKLADDKGLFQSYGATPDNTYFVIWTTTIWTLPGNVAITVGPGYQYDLIKSGNEFYVVAQDLAAQTFKAAGIAGYESVASFKGSELEFIKTEHPFLDRESLVIVGDHVTLETGTGVVHTAPGHGVEDFEVCRNYPDLSMPVPVDDKGRMTEEAGVGLAGLTTEEANKVIAEKLQKSGKLFASENIIHQYPHCWRCKQPVLFRATEQWFCSVNGFKEDTLEAIKSVEWIPAWGEDRIANMVKDRSDWCISRQRVWGVPLPIFYCEDCGKELIADETIRAVADRFRKEGADAWYLHEASEFIPEGTKCSFCSGKKFKKETDIMDVWFDSGVSHLAVCKERGYLKWPADVYLEGADQYRGWFQSSLLTSVACKGESPYKTVVTHGWVVDGEGRKMSKSLGNGIMPSEIVDQYGADILRLWVASSDYHADIRISKEILKQLSEIYRKIRNTARFILGCLEDFNPDKNMTILDDLESIDKWAMLRLNELIERVMEAYDRFEYHVIFHAIHSFCVVDMSNFYLDVIKDRLYVEPSNSKTRRAAQTVIYKVLDALALMIAPILCYTADEIWQYMPHERGKNPKHAVLNDMPMQVDIFNDVNSFETLFAMAHPNMDFKFEFMENARTAKVIGSSLESHVTVYAEAEQYELLKSVEEILPKTLIVSQLTLVRGEADKGEYKGFCEGVSVSVAHAEGEKCERCWTHSDTVGKSKSHPTLCKRCASIVK